MTPFYTIGDFTLSEIRPTLFTVTGERTSVLAYFDTLAAAEHHGHEWAKKHGVNLWRADVAHPRTTLIASYRPSQGS